jgi:hypothetical protein
LGEIPDIEDNYVCRKTNYDSSNDEGISSATVGDIWNGPKCLQIRKHAVESAFTLYLGVFICHVVRIMRKSHVLKSTHSAKCQRQVEDADIGKQLDVLS